MHVPGDVHWATLWWADLGRTPGAHQAILSHAIHFLQSPLALEKIQSKIFCSGTLPGWWHTVLVGSLALWTILRALLCEQVRPPVVKAWKNNLPQEHNLILHLQEIILNSCLNCIKNVPRLSHIQRAQAEVTQPPQFRNMHITTSLKISRSIYLSCIFWITSVNFPSGHYCKGYFYSRFFTGSKFWVPLKWLDTQFTIQSSNCEGQGTQAFL